MIRIKMVIAMGGCRALMSSGIIFTSQWAVYVGFDEGLSNFRCSVFYHTFHFLPFIIDVIFCCRTLLGLVLSGWGEKTQLQVGYQGYNSILAQQTVKGELELRRGQHVQMLSHGSRIISLSLTLLMLQILSPTLQLSHLFDFDNPIFAQILHQLGHLSRYMMVSLFNG